ncbi:MAG: IS110 family transposase [Terriglobales bacterium]
MSEYIAFDSHKRYTWVDRQDPSTGKSTGYRLEHSPGAVREYLNGCEPGTAVAVEATGNWYWIIDEIEQAGLQPQLVHPRKAKLMMGQINKTDKLDAQGLNRLQRNGTLPTVWIPPGPLRDLRELTRTRLVLVAQRTRLKNRLTATLAKYGAPPSACSDAYGKKGRVDLEKRLELLPEQARWVSQQLLLQLDFVGHQVRQLEERLGQLVEVTPEMQWLLTLPGVGVILAATIALEIGEVQRFPDAPHLASYSGTTPRVHASGGKIRYGALRADVNRYLKWAFAEAANSVAVNHVRCPDRHVSQLYGRLRVRKGHAKAIGAVARHLAEAAFHVLQRKEMYRDPELGRGRTSKV